MDLIVIRHGETDMNKDGRVQGCKGPDLPLNSTGVAQIVALRDALLVFPSTIYSSPLLRTKETTKILNDRFHTPVVFAPELVERDFGSLSGKLHKEINPEILERDLEGRYDYHPYGGEAAADVRARVVRFLATLPLASDETVLVVTHRGVIRILYDLYPNEVTPEEIIPGTKHVFHITALPA